MARMTVAVVILLLVTAVSWAQWTGQELHNGWQSWQRVELHTAEQADLLTGGMYAGFVRGVAAMLEDNGSVSLPSVSFSRVYSVVGKYLDDHPERWDVFAEVLVYAALHQVWPGKT
jgi:hypothetical protein